MPLPFLLAPLAGVAARAVAGQVAKEGLEKLTGGDKSEEKSKPEEKNDSAASTDAKF